MMDTIDNSVGIDIYTLLAALCSFCLLFRRRVSLALPYPERVFAFEQNPLHFDRRPFSCRPDTTKPGLSWGARSGIRLVCFGRRSGAGLALSSQFPGPATKILCRCRNSNAGGRRPPEPHLPWNCSRSAET